MTGMITQDDFKSVVELNMDLIFQNFHKFKKKRKKLNLENKVIIICPPPFNFDLPKLA